MRRPSLALLSPHCLLPHCLLLPWLLVACGPGVDREETLARLRAAIERDIRSEEQREAHNRLVVEVSDSRVLEGMRRHEVEEALGLGRACGADPLCARRGFRQTDRIYDIGRAGGFAAGPILVLGYDRQGVVRRTYYLVRRR